MVEGITSDHKSTAFCTSTFVTIRMDMTRRSTTTSSFVVPLLFILTV